MSFIRINLPEELRSLPGEVKKIDNFWGVKKSRVGYSVVSDPQNYSFLVLLTSLMQSWQQDRALEGSGLLIYAFVAFLGCAERQVTPAGSLDAPPRRLVWPGRSVLLAICILASWALMCKHIFTLAIL